MDEPFGPTDANTPASAWRPLLRGLPIWEGALPRFDPDTAPADPLLLFETWVREAIAGGVRIPHAATLSTASAGGDVSARTLLLKDLDGEGWWFASRTDGRKGRDLTTNPRATMTFFWREHGRQVRVGGLVADRGRAAADADFLARGVHSRASGIVGTQSAPLDSVEEYAGAFEHAVAELTAQPERTSPTWSAFVLQPTTVEFWSTTPDSGQIRLEYRRDTLDAPWRRGLLWP